MILRRVTVHVKTRRRLSQAPEAGTLGPARPQARLPDVTTLGAVVLVVILLAWQHLAPARAGI